jgi:hypothetical protein
MRWAALKPGTVLVMAQTGVVDVFQMGAVSLVRSLRGHLQWPFPFAARSSQFDNDVSL